MREDYASLNRKWEACERLANDPGATPGERESARTKAKQFRVLLDAMEVQTTDVGDANYKHYVEQGRQAVKNIHNSQCALGALAYNVRIEYGKSRLQQYADDIGAEYAALLHYRRTWQAWLTPQGRPESYSVAEALNPHPDRYKIVAKFPNLTVRQALEIVSLHKGKPTTRASSGGSSRQKAAPPPPPPPKLKLEQAREAYLELALKLPVKERNREAIKLLNLLGVKMS
jgi:hypothetical protein